MRQAREGRGGRGSHIPCRIWASEQGAFCTQRLAEPASQIAWVPCLAIPCFFFGVGRNLLRIGSCSPLATQPLFFKYVALWACSAPVRTVLEVYTPPAPTPAVRAPPPAVADTPEQLLHESLTACSDLHRMLPCVVAARPDPVESITDHCRPGKGFRHPAPEDITPLAISERIPYGRSHHCFVSQAAMLYTRLTVLTDPGRPGASCQLGSVPFPKIRQSEAGMAYILRTGKILSL